MLAENPTLSERRVAQEEYVIQITTPDPVREGVVDVLSLRGFVRALRAALGHSRTDDFERALARMINVNGALAQAIELEQQRRGLRPSGRNSRADC